MPHSITLQPHSRENNVERGMETRAWYEVELAGIWYLCSNSSEIAGLPMSLWTSDER